MTDQQARRLRGVYAITDAKLLGEKRLLPAVEEALAGGVSLVQYRNKSADWSVRLGEATSLQALCSKFGAMLLINDDIELCLAAGAAGVHLGQSDTSLVQARRTLGPDAIIGITCHNRDELVVKAEQEGASYIALGRFFPSETKPDAPAANLNDLRRVRQLTTLPIVAIGGVTADNGGALLDLGADMLAVIHYLFAKPDVKKRAEALAQLFA